MNIQKSTGILILIIALIMGCSGRSANIKNQSGDESKVTQKKLINNWSDYDVRYNSVVLVFDPKNDDKKILVDSYWSTAKDQETWILIVKANSNTTTGFREIRGPENQFYGYVIHQRRELVSAKVIDENTVRLIHNYAVFGGP